MKLALLCPNVSGNPLVRTYPIGKVLARRHDVQVLGFELGDGVFEPYREAFAYETVRARRNPLFWSQVRALSQRVDAEAIYVFKPLPSSLWVGLLASRRLGVPLFLDIEDWEVGWYLDVPLSHRVRHLAHIERPNGLLWAWLTERLVTRCDHVFVVSRFLQSRFGGTILPHGPDTALFDPARFPREEARRRIGLPEGRFAVFTGSPMRNKGLDDFLRAMELVAADDLKLLIVGSFAHDPAYADELMRRHGSRIVMVGPRPHGEMPWFLAAADLVALPQRVTRETVAQVPGKVFEAMAMAKPILATTVGDLPEILGGCAELVEPGSVEAIAEGLSRLLIDPEAGVSMGVAARERCVDRYGWDAMESILTERLERLS